MAPLIPQERSLLKSTLFALAFLLLYSYSYSQQNAFSTMNAPDQVIGINVTHTESVTLQPFISRKPISGLSISADIILFSDTSLVRVVLTDTSFNEYLVYEAYPLISGSQQFSIEEAAEETALLNNVVPLELRIELSGASIYLKEIRLSKAGIYAREAKGNIRQAQLNERIGILNRNLIERGIPWVAGETSFSRLSYEEKKAYFGGDLPNLGGFDYYTGGVFVMPGALDQDPDQAVLAGANPDGWSPYVKEFDWRDRHGQDWVTPVKDQGQCGSCWAFAAAGATEHMVNIYFNRKLDLDLSEQYLLSCSGTGSCNGGMTYRTVNFIKNSGIMEEDCFPYQASDVSCSNKCPNPDENIQIGNYRNYIDGGIDVFKQVVIDGASTFSIVPWGHSITLVGYKELEAGDRVYIKSSSESRWVTITAQSGLVGEIAWILKNSWGTNWGDGGFAYVVTNRGDINPYHTCQLYGPVTSLNFDESDIGCTDNDGDGYYYWGTGPKPAHCPPCPDEPDGDDSNGCFGPMDAYGHLQSTTAPEPEAEDVTVFYGQTVPPLTATGSNIRWYSDFDMTNLVHSGNSFSTGRTDIGVYVYYATQTIGSCESPPKAVVLTILQGTTPPGVEDREVCEGSKGILTATGENIRWYAEAGLTTLLHEGNQYVPGVTTAGTYQFFATQTTGGVESGYAVANYLIKRAPEPFFAEDRTYCAEEGLYMYAKGDSIKWYESGFIHRLLDERDNRIYRVVNIGTQMWMAENLDFGVRIDGSQEQTNNGVIEKYTYNDDPSYGTAYGGLYQWDEMMLYSTEPGARGVCPDGWHIPTHREWIQLEIALGMDEIVAEELGMRGTDEGDQLMLGGSSGFEALLGGKRNLNGYFENMDFYATFWTSDGYTRSLGESFDGIWASRGDNPEQGFSVRCVMDEESLVTLGNRLYLDDYTPGDYAFKVTNTYDGCESFPKTAHLILKETPDPPVVPDVEACTGDPSPGLVATGEQIRWYSDYPDEPLVDSRDGREYDVVNIGRQVWMAENLDVGTIIPGAQDMSDNGIIEKYHYNNDPAMGALYGGLYQWNEMMGYDTMENTQGICPDGWEVPSQGDWMKMEMALGMDQPEVALLEWRGTDQGMQLKEGGSSGFDVLMGGKRDPWSQFKSEGSYATIWNSSGYTRTFQAGTDRPQVYNSKYDSDDNGFSVRCIMNDSAYTSPGNVMAIPGNIPGTYTFEVTQTVDGCESAGTMATLIIRQSPEPPTGTDVSVCAGGEVPSLEVEGENISWYSDPGLTQLVYSGNPFSTGHTAPGTYTYYATQMLTECEGDALVISLEIKPVPDAPVVADVEVCEGSAVPDLVAEGTGIRWYSDEALQVLAGSGDSLTTGITEPGTYAFYATQTMDECEGAAATATLVVIDLPQPPEGQDLFVCEGEEIPDLEVTGENVSWYSDPGRTQLVYSGNPFSTGETAPGTYTYYVTQKVAECEGDALVISLEIKPVPEIDLGNDTMILESQILILGPFESAYEYLWNDGSSEPYMTISGQEYGIGVYQISVRVMLNGCIFNDTVVVTVESNVGSHDPDTDGSYRIYPNPTRREITVEFRNEISQDILVEIYSANGILVQQYRYSDLPGDIKHPLQIQLGTPGLYFLKIVEEGRISEYKLIRL